MASMGGFGNNIIVSHRIHRSSQTGTESGAARTSSPQPRNPTTSVTSQGTQTLALQLQNAETQTEREEEEPGAASSGPGEGEGSEYGGSGEDALSRIQRLMAEGGMTAVVQREQSNTCGVKEIACLPDTEWSQYMVVNRSSGVGV